MNGLMTAIGDIVKDAFILVKNWITEIMSLNEDSLDLLDDISTAQSGSAFVDGEFFTMTIAKPETVSPLRNIMMKPFTAPSITDLASNPPDPKFVFDQWTPYFLDKTTLIYSGETSYITYDLTTKLYSAKQTYAPENISGNYGFFKKTTNRYIQIIPTVTEKQIKGNYTFKTYNNSWALQNTYTKDMSAYTNELTTADHFYSDGVYLYLIKLDKSIPSAGLGYQSLHCSIYKFSETLAYVSTTESFLDFGLMNRNDTYSQSLAYPGLFNTTNVNWIAPQLIHGVWGWYLLGDVTDKPIFSSLFLDMNQTRISANYNFIPPSIPYDPITQQPNPGTYAPAIVSTMPVVNELLQLWSFNEIRLNRFTIPFSPFVFYVDGNNIVWHNRFNNILRTWSK